MKFLDPALRFDPRKPFYPLVVGCMAQIHGLVELASRSIYLQLRSKPAEELDAFLASEGDEEVKGHMRRIRESGLTGLIGKQRLDAKLSSQSVTVDVDELARHFVTNHKPVMEFFNRQSTGSLLILAWENTSAHHTRDPQWEFLRRCRNAAAHNGRFTFHGQEPRYRAEWRGQRIERSLQGHPLFPDPPAPGFLALLCHVHSCCGTKQA